MADQNRNFVNVELLEISSRNLIGNGIIRFLTSIRLIKKGFSRLKYPPHVAHVDGKVYFASSPVLGLYFWVGV